MAYDTSKGAAVAVSNEMKLAACGPGIQAIAVVGDKVLLMSAMGPGFPVTATTMPVPPVGGRIVALDAAVPTALTEDGTMWHFERGAVQWSRIANLTEVSAQ